jgi:glycerol-3-phosphate dehydrogenase (NAD(P)+)
MYEYAIVVGAGAFGTSIASVLSENFKTVIVKVRSEDVYESIKNGENSLYLPGQKLAKNIIPALTWEELDGIVNNGKVELLVNGLPTSAINPFYTQNRDLITYLSGPSFAKEIIDKQVTIVALAGKTPDTLLDVCKKTGTDYFRCIPTYDVKGVLLGGALKNILAIAGGILEGLGYNHNTRAAMITRGINEMLRFGKVFNGRPETFYSFAGMGDLILTTTSSLSRNKTFGLDIATSGKTPEELINSQRSVVEGYKTTQAAYNLAQKYKIRAPLFDGVYQILYNGVEPEDVLKRLMRMPVNTIE